MKKLSMGFSFFKYFTNIYKYYFICINMKEILFFEGNYETIILPKNSDKVKMFYTVLYNLFESKGFQRKNINTNSKEQLEETVSEKSCFLVGHSQGATRILKQFSSEKYPQIKGIILFDPECQVEKGWNSLDIPKILFASTQEEWAWGYYLNFQDRIEVDDDHYFTNSIEKILPMLKKFIS